VDGMGGRSHLDEVHLLGVTVSQLDRPATMDLARIGAEVLLPGVTGGLYLNLGQLADFFAGLLGFDPAGDDCKTSSQEKSAPSSGPGAKACAP
jgi:hypothetical protein